MTLIVDVSVALKWILNEPDSHLAQALVEADEALLLPDFLINEACNICWLQVRKDRWTPAEAREGLALLRAVAPPTATGELDLHDVALDIGLAVNHSTHDTLYVAFAIAMGARGVVIADGRFARSMARHPDPLLAAMLIPLVGWADRAG